MVEFAFAAELINSPEKESGSYGNCSWYHGRSAGYLDSDSRQLGLDSGKYGFFSRQPGYFGYLEKMGCLLEKAIRL